VQLSHSQITTFLDCPEKYRLTRIEKHEEIPAWYLVGGKAVHSCTEVLDTVHWEMEPDDPKIHDIWVSVLNDAISDAQQEDSTGTEMESWRMSRKRGHDWWLENGERMARNWVRMRGERQLALLDDDVQMSIELYVTAVFGIHQMRGYIDRVMVTPDGEIGIFDLKTGQAPKDMLQLGLYMLMLEDEYGIPASFAEYALVDKGEWAGRIDMKATRRQIDQYVQWVAGAVEAGTFVPSPGIFCSSCAVREFCSIKDLLPEPAKAAPKVQLTPLKKGN
jgi:CRISPR/Cas system-associated exonuclease Cas4 (RecB family)